MLNHKILWKEYLVSLYSREKRLLSLLVIIYLVSWIFFHQHLLEMLFLGCVLYYVFKYKKNNLDKFLCAFFLLFCFILANLLSYKNPNAELKVNNSNLVQTRFIIVEEPEKRMKVHSQLQIRPMDLNDSQYYALNCGLFKENGLECPRNDYGEIIDIKYLKLRESLVYRLFNKKEKMIYYQISYKENFVNRENYLHDFFDRYYKNHVVFIFYVFVSFLFYVFFIIKLIKSNKYRLLG